MSELHGRASTTDSNRQEKELANLKRCHCKLTRPRSKKKKMESEQSLWEPGSPMKQINIFVREVPDGARTERDREII